MPATLDSTERDALWAQVTANLTAFDDLERALEEGDDETCYRLGRKIADGLRLILDGGLGWQQRSSGFTALTLPDQELRQIMMRMREQAVSHHEARRPEVEAAESELETIALVRAAADKVWEQTAG